jgi:predicted RNase H-like HicB family nuclease
MIRRYAIVIEDAGSNLAAYLPDLPGCVATAESEEEVNRLIREAIDLHLEGLEEDGLPIPEPSRGLWKFLCQREWERVLLGLIACQARQTVLKDDREVVQRFSPFGNRQRPLLRCLVNRHEHELQC